MAPLCAQTLPMITSARVRCSDLQYPVRRAIMLRTLLGCGGEADNDTRLKIDPGLLTTLLQVGHCRNGARSLDKLLAHVFRNKSAIPSRSYLPSSAFPR